MVASPGPDFAVTQRNSLLCSRRTGVYTAVGRVAGNLVYATYCLVGVGVIISQSIVLVNAVKWLGVAYRIYLGIRYLIARRHDIQEVTDRPRGTQDIGPLAAARLGFLTNLLNPKMTLFFLALFTQIIRPETLPII